MKNYRHTLVVRVEADASHGHNSVSITGIILEALTQLSQEHGWGSRTVEYLAEEILPSGVEFGLGSKFQYRGALDRYLVITNPDGGWNIVSTTTGQPFFPSGGFSILQLRDAIASHDDFTLTVALLCSGRSALWTGDISL